MRAMAAFRYRVFVERLGWSLPCCVGCELDQYDDGRARYVLLFDANDRICGCARLRSTSDPYMLRDLFPFLLHGVPAPCSERTLELSRFAALANGFHGAAQRLLADTAATALQQGATRLITVSPPAIERLLRRMGVNVYPAAALSSVDGQVAGAYWIELDRQTIDALEISASLREAP